jgi:hypothetical protein
MTTEEIINALKDLGYKFPDDIVEQVEHSLWGEKQEEWTGAQRQVLAKAVEKELKKFSTRFEEKASHIKMDVVDQLWRSGWDLQIRYNQSVVGIEIAVKNYVDHNYPEKLSQTNLDDPYLVQVENYFKAEHHKFEEQDKRMILRAKDEVKVHLYQYVIAWLKENGKPEAYWSGSSVVRIAKQIQQELNKPQLF